MTTVPPPPPALGEACRDHRVVVLSRAGCHLCVEAEAVVADAAAGGAFSWCVVDVDEAGGEVRSAYDALVPVVIVDGTPVAHWRLLPEELESALAQGDRGAGWWSWRWRRRGGRGDAAL